MEQTNYQYELSFHEVFKKDSLEITEEDREKLKNYITRLSEKTIIITHGSDTLLETSEVLSRIPNKTILLTAAMLPEKFKDSDAHFNLGMAFGGAQIFLCQQLGSGFFYFTNISSSALFLHRYSFLIEITFLLILI
jgi:L-asparaginase/Glu-tRNA(Gln) amidotransferase subunit D